jgi:L-ascorbate metabolism protein UlaG (beta-lactamase superfamily)
VPPGIPIKNLPKIDVVAISHNHIDHMDKRSLLAIKHHNPIILVPKGDGRWFSRKKFENVIENKWGDSHTIKNVKLTYLPASHWTGRGFFDYNKSICGSWMIDDSYHKIYFAGDSSYDKHFCEIAQEFPSIKTALLPIGPIEPRSGVEHAHLDSTQALQAFIDLQAKQFIPMHWGTFQFGAEEFEVPIKILEEIWKKEEANLDGKKLLILKFGQGEIVT